MDNPLSSFSLEAVLDGVINDPVPGSVVDELNLVCLGLLVWLAPMDNVDTIDKLVASIRHQWSFSKKKNIYSLT